MEIYARMRSEISTFESYSKLDISKFEYFIADLSPKNAFCLVKFLAELNFGDPRNVAVTDNEEAYSGLHCTMLDRVLNSLNYIANPDLLINILSLLRQILEDAREKQSESNPMLYVALFSYCRLCALAKTFESDTSRCSIKGKDVRKMIEYYSYSAVGNQVNLCLLSQLFTWYKKTDLSKWNWDCMVGPLDTDSDTYSVLEAYIAQELPKYLSIIMPQIIHLAAIGYDVLDFLTKCLDFALSDTNKLAICQLLGRLSHLAVESSEHCVISALLRATSRFIQCDFSCGHDIALWIDKISINYSTDQNIVDAIAGIVSKFCLEFSHLDEVWKGSVENLANVTKLINLVEFLTHLDFEAMQMSTISALFSLAIVLATIASDWPAKLQSGQNLKSNLAIIFASCLSRLDEGSDFLKFGDSSKFVLKRTIHSLVENESSANHGGTLELISAFSRYSVDYSIYVIDALDSLLSKHSAQQVEILSNFCSQILPDCHATIVEIIDRFDRIFAKICKLNRQNFAEIANKILPSVVSILRRQRCAGKLGCAKVCKYMDNISAEFIKEDGSVIVGKLSNFPLLFEFISEQSIILADCELLITLLIHYLSASVISIDKCAEWSVYSVALSTNMSNFRVADLEKLFGGLKRTDLFIAQKLIIDSLEMCQGEISLNVLEMIKDSLIGCIHLLPLWSVTQFQANQRGIENCLCLCLSALKMKKIKIISKRLNRDILTMICSIDFVACSKSSSNIVSLVCLLLAHLAKFKYSVVNNVHVFMTLFTQMQVALIALAWECGPDGHDQKFVFDCVLKFSRLLSLVSKKFEVDFSKTAPYLIGDFVESVKNKPLAHQRIRDLFLTYVYDWLDICDQHAVALLATNLDDSSKEIFRMIYEDYQKYFKYKGFV